MSGSTRVERAGERVRAVLETPCISFALNPDGTSPERGYHDSARARFEAVFDRLWPGLEDRVVAEAAAAGLSPVALDGAPHTARILWRATGGHLQIGLPSAPDPEAIAVFTDRVQPLLAEPEPEPAAPPPEPPRRWWWPW